MYSIYTQYYIILTLVFSVINLDHMESYLHKYDSWWIYFRKCLVTRIFIPKCFLCKHGRVLSLSINLHLRPRSFSYTIENCELIMHC